jgi:hypothetical protein
MHLFTAELGINPLVTPNMLRPYAKPYESKLDLNAGGKIKGTGVN